LQLHFNAAHGDAQFQSLAADNLGNQVGPVVGVPHIQAVQNQAQDLGGHVTEGGTPAESALVSLLNLKLGLFHAAHEVLGCFAWVGT